MRPHSGRGLRRSLRATLRASATGAERFPPLALKAVGRSLAHLEATGVLGRGPCWEGVARG